jgi:hypothetical protein
MQEPDPGGASTAPAHTAPSSSRMVAGYLTDVERLLEEQHWDAALREAFDLPRIAVALTDPKLHSSPEQQRTWCEQWIRPAGSQRAAQQLDYERVRGTVYEHLAHEQDAAARKPVPARALRRLRLRRHVRSHPRVFRSAHEGPLDPQASETTKICTALVEAARRWYARSGVHDSIVQENLARLAVLR